MTRRLADLFLLAVPRGVRDHRGLFFGIVGTTALASALSSTSLSAQVCCVTFSVGLVSLGSFLHSRNDSAIPMVLEFGVLRARSLLRLHLPNSSLLDICFDCCRVVGDSVLSFASCAFLCTLVVH